MPLQATSGAASQDAFGGNGVAVVPTYIEDVFSCFLYTGTNATQTITNGIDLSTKGGLVWSKSRSAVGDHHLYDTARGLPKVLFSNGANPSTTYASGSDLSSFNTTGFSLGPDDYGTNTSGVTYASWTWRKQPKFFDVVTYTGNGSAQNISHALGSVPACIIVKRTNTAGFDWLVYHRSTGNTNRLLLNDTASAASGTSFWNDTTPTSTVFTVGSNVNVNQSGGSYVAYLFAHDAGGFGLTGTDNVISCGSFTIVSNVASVTLGYEPQWTMIKRTDSTDSWIINDVMRGSLTAGGQNRTLYANLADVEGGGTAGTHPTATGFTVQGLSDGTYIYIAIRRGPMKVPTTGTSVFNSIARTGTGATASVESGFVTDLIIDQRRSAGGDGGVVWDRLRGAEKYLFTRTTGAEGTTSNSLTSFANMNGVTVGADSGQAINVSGQPWINWMFRRAPSFMDVVCWTAGSSTNRRITHNLTVAPELIINKSRSAAQNWPVYSAALGINSGIVLNTTAAAFSATGLWGTSAPTSTDFGIDETYYFLSGYTIVSYLFSTCAGVSKVGSYTGNGSTQTINCGFGAGGARFVLIKATSTTGNWMTFDTARGMTVVTDPFLSLNSLAAETATLGACTTVSTGFAVNEAILTGINTDGVSYIFLSVA